MRIRVLALALGTGAVLAGVAGATMSPVVSSKLSGKNEKPTKGALAGSGIVTLHLNAKKGTVCWEFKGVRGFANPNAAHIHKGGRLTAGPVVVPFGAAYKAKGCTKAAAKTVAAIEEHPNAYYVNVHSAKYPGGAIRGQLVAGMIGG
jgi:CHRD domain-containing protein